MWTLLSAVVLACAIGAPQLLETANAQFIINPYRHAAAGEELDPDLVMWLEFDADTDPQPDSSETGNTAAYVGTPAWSSDNGGIMTFDSSDADKLQITDNATLDCTNAITISFWFKANDLDFFQVLVSKERIEGGDTWGTHLFNNALRCEVETTVSIYQNSVAGIVTGQWYHVVTAWSEASGDHITYTNGVQAASNLSPTSGFMANDTKDVMIAGRGALWGLNGSVDDVKIFNAEKDSTWVNDEWNDNKATYGF